MFFEHCTIQRVLFSFAVGIKKYTKYVILIMYDTYNYVHLHSCAVYWFVCTCIACTFPVYSVETCTWAWHNLAFVRAFTLAKE